jgi:hypothetical protein
MHQLTKKQLESVVNQLADENYQLEQELKTQTKYICLIDKTWINQIRKIRSFVSKN